MNMSLNKNLMWSFIPLHFCFKRLLLHDRNLIAILFLSAVDANKFCMVVEQPIGTGTKIKEQRSNCIIKISVQMKKESVPINRGAFIYMILIYYLDFLAND